MNAELNLRKICLYAAIATVIFWGLTFWTRYPFLVDDYIFIEASHAPDFSVSTFGFLVTQRPLMALLNFFTYKYHLFEKTKILFAFYYFAHSIGVLLILDFLMARFKDLGLIDRRVVVLPFLAVLTCLYPSWFEITLMALNLPYGLGVFFLGIAFSSRSLWVRFPFLFLAFSSFETYFFPAIALTGMEIYAGYRSGKANSGRINPSGLVGLVIAFVSYLVLYLFLKTFVSRPRYDSEFSLHGLLIHGFDYAKLLATESFYKTNWVSSALEWTLITAASIALVLREKKNHQLIILAISLPLVGIGHSLVVRHYAPRAIHGGMVLKAVCLSILLMSLYAQGLKNVFKVTLTLLACSFFFHTGVVVFNRKYDNQLLEARTRTIEEELIKCEPPCKILMSDFEDQLHWDWMMTPGFHRSFVNYILTKNGIHKEVLIF